MRLLLVRILLQAECDRFTDVVEEFVYAPALGIASAQPRHLADVKTVFVPFDQYIELTTGHGRSLLSALAHIPEARSERSYYLLRIRMGKVILGCSAILAAKQLGSCCERVTAQLLVHSRTAAFVLHT
jgi:hypothetical protein